MNASQTNRPNAASNHSGVIEIRINEIEQLFNSLDPTPFPKKDLDSKAEDFIVSWATEVHRHSPLKLRVHLAKPADEHESLTRVTEAVHAFFSYRSEMTRRRLRHLMERGRLSLLIGLLFLAACLTTADLLTRVDGSRLLSIVRESLIIGGWVAMWRPLEIFLYDWWPLRAERRIYNRLSHAEVEVIVPAVVF